MTETSPIDRLRSLYYRLPESFQRAVLVKRRENVWLQAGIVFIHVPKAAGTSINQALYGRFMGHVRAADIERWGSARLKALPSFAIVRNPWDRLVSAYRFAVRGHGTGGMVQAGIRHPERYAGPLFQSFESFVSQWLAKRRISDLDGIFQLQSSFICGADGLPLVDFVGRTENFIPTLEFIQSAIGSSYEIPKANRSGEQVNYRDFYTPSLASLVGEIYAADVDRFGYRF